jgi:PKD repeat protein
LARKRLSSSHFEVAIMKYLIVCAFLVFAGQSGAATRVYYEGCESVSGVSSTDSTYVDHFLEWHVGSSYESSFTEMQSEISQSGTAYAGTYSMVYNPITTGNPYCQVGVGSATYGNLSDFALSDTDNRYWYFRWYQRWEDSTYSGDVKIWYMGCGISSAYIAKSGDSSVIIAIRDEPNGDLIASHNGGWSVGDGLDDEEWHKMEVYWDLGTGSSDGEFWIRVDGTEAYSFDGLSLNTPSPSGYNMGCLAWPSNTSGTISGSQQTWLDEFEIYTLTGPTDIPGTGPTAEFSGTPISGTAPLSVAFTDASTSTPLKWHWDFGDAATDTSALQNPTHEYDAVGIYTVTLTVYNADGTDSEVKTGYITVTDGSGNTLAGLSASVDTGTMSGSWTTDGAASWTVEAVPASGRSYSIWTENASFSFPVGATAYDVLVTSEDGPTATTSTGG